MSSYYPGVTYHSSARGDRGGDPRRSQQINELVSAFPSLKSLRADRSLLEYHLQLRDGRILDLTIAVPKHYPDAPPEFILGHSIKHPWVDSNQRIHAPEYSNWQPHMRLLDAFKHIQEGLIGRPSPIPGPSASQRHQEEVSTVSSDQRNLVSHLRQYSETELFGFLSEDAKYQSLVKTLMPTLQSLEGLPRMRKKSVQLATENLERQSEIQERQNQIAIVKSTEYPSTLEIYNQKLEEHREVCELINIPKLLDDLHQDITQIDEKSDALLRTVVNDESPVDNFVEDYFNLRQDFHKKDILYKSGTKLC